MSNAKLVLITGGGKRIGASIAKKLHREGFDVALHYRRSQAEAETLAEQFNTHRADSAFTLQADLRDSTAPQALVDACLAQKNRLDVLVNNASAFFPTPVETATPDDWALLTEVNARAPFFLSQAAAPALAQHRGCIVNLIDIYAERPLADHPIYVASKAALAALTRALARDLAPEIRVNGIAPGAILWPDAEDNTDALAIKRQSTILQRTPLERLGTPDDIANTAHFLIAGAAFISGQIIGVDGGRSVVP